MFKNHSILYPLSIQVEISWNLLADQSNFNKFERDLFIYSNTMILPEHSARPAGLLFMLSHRTCHGGIWNSSWRGKLDGYVISTDNCPDCPVILAQLSSITSSHNAFGSFGVIVVIANRQTKGRCATRKCVLRSGYLLETRLNRSGVRVPPLNYNSFELQ